MATAVMFNLALLLLVVSGCAVTLGWFRYGNRKRKLSKKAMDELTKLRNMNGNGSHKRKAS